MHKNALSKSALATTIAAVLLSSAAPVVAEPSAPAASPGALESVVVTAQRREQKLEDVGIAMDVLGGEDLKLQGLSSSTDLADFAPGVHMGGSLAGQSFQFSIRGVTQNDYSDTIEAPVAVYIDDGYVPAQQGQTLAMFDISRVEILKGPQGTLYGRNATGGLVHFVVNKPTKSFEASGDLSYGRFGETKFEGAVSGPLSDRVAVRLSGFYNRLDNFWKNVYPAGAPAGFPTTFGPPLATFGQNEGGFETKAGRLQVEFDVSDALKIRLVGSTAHRSLSTAAYTGVATTPVVNADGTVIDVIRTGATDTRTIIGPDGQNYFNPTLFPLQGAQTGIGFGPGPGLRFPGATWFGYQPIDPQSLTLSVQFASKDANHDTTNSGALHIDYDFGNMTLTSVSNYMNFSKMLMMDASGTPENLFQYGTESHTSTFSQEFRLAGHSDEVQWVAGTYFLHVDASTRDGLIGSTGSLFSGVFGLSTTGVDPLANRTLKTDSTSLFGQVEYAFAPQWTLIAGARGVSEHQNYDLSYGAYQNTNDYSVDSSVMLFPLPYDSFHDSRTQHLFAGKVQLEFRPAPGLLWFLGVNRGVKAGSYNAKTFDGSPSAAASEIPYNPEVLTSVEGGVKWSPPGGSSSLNANAFHYNYRDYQAYLFTTNSGVVKNVDAKTNGLEIQGTTKLGSALTASLSYAYIDAKIPAFSIAPGIYRDVVPTFTSKNAAAFELKYALPVSLFGGHADFAASVTYSSSFFDNLRNFTADELAGRTLANAQATWFSSEDRWHVGAYIKNIGDKRYPTVGFDSAANCGCSIEAYGMPRTYGVTVGAKF